MADGCLDGGDWELTHFAVRSKPAMTAQTSAGDCVASPSVLTTTFLITVFAVLSERARAGAVASSPAGRTETLSDHRVTLGPSLAVTDALAVEAEESLGTRVFAEHAAPARRAETTTADVLA